MFGSAVASVFMRDVFVATLSEVAWIECTDQAKAWPQRGKLRNYRRHPDLSRSALFPHGASAIDDQLCHGSATHLCFDYEGRDSRLIC